jgi:hypothetical protein
MQLRLIRKAAVSKKTKQRPKMDQRIMKTLSDAREQDLPTFACTLLQPGLTELIRGFCPRNKPKTRA